MSEEEKELNKELNNKECCEENKELSLKELDSVNGGGATEAALELQGKVAGVETTPTDNAPRAKASICVR